MVKVEDVVVVKAEDAVVVEEGKNCKRKQGSTTERMTVVAGICNHVFRPR